MDNETPQGTNLKKRIENGIYGLIVTFNYLFVIVFILMGSVMFAVSTVQQVTILELGAGDKVGPLGLVSIFAGLLYYQAWRGK